MENVPGWRRTAGSSRRSAATGSARGGCCEFTVWGGEFTVRGGEFTVRGGKLNWLSARRMLCIHSAGR
eukprot:4851476-Pyramimonas_sp.AAC.1